MIFKSYARRDDFKQLKIFVSVCFDETDRISTHPEGMIQHSESAFIVQ